jgi:dTDP-4-dehydrorhamnose 3,5-epimerase
MIVRETNLPGLRIIEPRVFADARGWFMETYQSERLATARIADTFVQDNHSFSHRGVLRGLHYQIQHPQGKLVRVVHGAIFDVAVDLRRDSATFGRWFGAEISAENRLQLYVPAGFAHGFLALSETAEVTYKCTDLYHPESERTLLWNDPAIGITWPLVQAPTLSDKDRLGKLLSEAECFEADDRRADFQTPLFGAAIKAPHFSIGSSSTPSKTSSL